MGFLNGQVTGLFYHFSALKSWASSHLKITKPISKLRVLFFFGSFIIPVVCFPRRRDTIYQYIYKWKKMMKEYMYVLTLKPLIGNVVCVVVVVVVPTPPLVAFEKYSYIYCGLAIESRLC